MAPCNGVCVCVYHFCPSRCARQLLSQEHSRGRARRRPAGEPAIQGALETSLGEKFKSPYGQSSSKTISGTRGVTRIHRPQATGQELATAGFQRNVEDVLHRPYRKSINKALGFSITTTLGPHPQCK
ncbi:TCDD-inducible poly [Platysternon megacephalum]|uniref:TCDD-inducible poly n=1 Tax=Platysternon megacephalum TaxID=55544 RepID=A0A4D9DX55_9SAUR|nr:TCDD-inducible poly [Platysternon megacephalum]